MSIEEFEKAVKALRTMQQKRWEDSPIEHTPWLNALSKRELQRLIRRTRK